MKASQPAKTFQNLSPIAMGVTLLLMAIIILLSGKVSHASLNGILLCGKTLIPALFPCLVLSGILVRLGFPLWIGRKVGRPIGWLFGISPACVAAVFVGLLSGFPTGAVAAHGIVKKGLGTARDGQRTIFLSTIAAPGFLIAGVGSSLLNSIHRGLTLYLLQLAAIFTVGIWDAHLWGTSQGKQPPLIPQRESKNLFLILSESLREATNTMLGICGTVIFFSTLGGILTLLPLPDLLRCLLIGFFEITAGTAMAASQLPPTAAYLVIAAIIGWAGLSVHGQIMLATEGDLKVGRFFLSKFLTAILTLVFAAITLLLGIV